MMKDFLPTFRDITNGRPLNNFKFSLIKIVVPGNSFLDLEISLLVPVFNIMGCEAMLLYHGLMTKPSGLNYWLCHCVNWGKLPNLSILQFPDSHIRVIIIGL